MLDQGQFPDLRLLIEPTSSLLEQIAERDREASQSLKAFELIPEFPLMIVGMHERIEEVRRQADANPLLKERVEVVLTCLDIRAAEFLKLVSNLELQNTFITILQQLKRIAWQEYVGLAVPAELVQAEGSESLAMEQAIFERGQYWVTKGYKHIANAGITPFALESGSRGISTLEEREAVSGRRAVVDSFLFSCNQDANLRVKLIRKHIWSAVRHTNPRQFQYWQSSNERGMTAQNDQDFRRILSMPPTEFVALLKRMKLIC